MYRCTVICSKLYCVLHTVNMWILKLTYIPVDVVVFAFSVVVPANVIVVVVVVVAICYLCRYCMSVLWVQNACYSDLDI